MDRGKAICEELKKVGIHHIVWLPDSETHFMHDAMHSDPGMKVVPVCREGEAVAICAGMHLGGKGAVVLVENQGIFECGNVLKWAIEMKAPLLLMIGYMGFRYLKDTPQGKMRDTRKDYTEPFLDSYGIKHYLVDSDKDVEKIAPAFEEAQASGMPVALLLTSADGFVAGT